VETGTEARTPRVRKVAFTGVEAEAAAIPGSQVQASRKPGLIKEGGIRRFRDHQGVLHVTNTPQAGKIPEPERWKLTHPGF